MACLGLSMCSLGAGRSCWWVVLTRGDCFTVSASHSSETHGTSGLCSLFALVPVLVSHFTLKYGPRALGQLRNPTPPSSLAAFLVWMVWFYLMPCTQMPSACSCSCQGCPVSWGWELLEGFPATHSLSSALSLCAEWFNWLTSCESLAWLMALINTPLQVWLCFATRQGTDLLSLSPADQPDAGWEVL